MCDDTKILLHSLVKDHATQPKVLFRGALFMGFGAQTRTIQARHMGLGFTVCTGYTVS